MNALTNICGNEFPNLKKYDKAIIHDTLHIRSQEITSEPIHVKFIDFNYGA